MKKYSHSIITKIIAFTVAVLSLTGIIHSLFEVEGLNNGYFSSVAEENYIESRAYIHENEKVLSDLILLLSEYKNEENIKNGGSITDKEWNRVKEHLFIQYRNDPQGYQFDLNDSENYERFEEIYRDKISRAKENLIKDELREFHLLLQKLKTYDEPYFYASDGTNVFKNINTDDRQQFESYPAHMIFDRYERKIFPISTTESEVFNRMVEKVNNVDPEKTVIYLAFSQDFLDRKEAEWQENKAIATKNLIYISGLSILLILVFIYLFVVIGRKSFNDRELHFYFGDRVYNDVHIVITTLLITIYALLVDSLLDDIVSFIVPIFIPINALALLLILALVKHKKNKTLMKHTLLYRICYRIVHFIREVYRSGSVGIKTVMLVIGYPVLIALTFFMFPVTIGVATWYAYKKVKAFQAIQEGVETVKGGNLQHRIQVNGNGEFARLATNINTITEGLNKAVESELKSERLKTELITNVSHDIRTPLTSIITYVDLLKSESNPEKIANYIEILEQKSARLKNLTDDLFDAAKATSGNIPVQLDKIDIVSLVTQGLGEFSDKMEEHDLHFKVNYPNEKIYVTADGNLLWRSLENLLTNILKYSLKGSRVYISIEDRGTECLLTFKNISAVELNISPEELIERFKRGDEARSSEGSGLGLSIAKSLIEIQKGRFDIEIDGDLFKALVYLSKATVGESRSNG